VLLTVVALAALGTALAPRVAQDLAYHDFADRRDFLGLPNAMDVLSNVPFILVGWWGLMVALRGRHSTPQAFADPWLFWPWATLFIGTLLTGVGSGWYHLAPDNARLVWDRLPMTIGFMGLLSAVLAERVSLRAGRLLLLPLLLLGAGSVFYWDWTERQGRGDLRPYGLIQFGSMLVLLLVLLLYPTPGPAPSSDGGVGVAATPRLGSWRSRIRASARRGGTFWLVAALLAYVAAKITEALDRPILNLGEAFSGHTLKHLFAAAAVGCVAWMLRARTRREQLGIEDGG